MTDIKTRLIAALYPPNEEVGDEDDALHPGIAAEDILWTICTDNPNVMRSLRRKCVESGHYTFEFGCAPHALHNLCKDLLKMAGPKSTLGKVLVVVKGIRNVHLLTSMFDMLCAQKLNTSYVLILFTTSRWTTSTFALKRLLLVKQVLVAMPHSIDHDDTFRAVSMCADLRDIILDTVFWQHVVALHRILLPLNACTGFLEGDEATLSVVYACFLGVAHHFRTIDDDQLLQLRLERHTLLELIHSRFKTIFSPAHALALMTDPLFGDMVANLKRLHGNTFVELGQGPVLANCRDALRQFANDDARLCEQLLIEFACFMQRRIGKDDYFFVMRHMQPGLIWAQMDEQQYQHLAPALVKLHGNPAGSVGGERNHKTTKRVQSKQRVRLKRGRVEKQTSIAYNSAIMERVVEKKRSGDFITKLAALGSEVLMFNDDSEDEEFDDDFRDANIGMGAEHVLDDYFVEEVLEEGPW